MWDVVKPREPGVLLALLPLGLLIHLLGVLIGSLGSPTNAGGTAVQLIVGVVTLLHGDGTGRRSSPDCVENFACEDEGRNEDCYLLIWILKLLPLLYYSIN